MAHSHHHHHASVSHKLTVATGANLLVVVAEVSIGIYAGSLALVGDALHNLTDVAALIIALFALRLERKTPTTEKSFGYQRAGILAAFVNSALLLAFTFFLFREAWSRLQHPQEVETTLMLAMAAVALLVNAATAFSIHHESREDVNVRGAFIHMIGDAVSSAGIIVAAILIRLTGNPMWDAGVTMLIALLILWSSYGVLRESMNLLLEGTPAGIDPAAVTISLGKIEGILGVHHLHIWALGPSSPALSCHIMVGDVPVKNTAGLLDEITTMLSHEYRIAHATIQFEFAECAADDPYCTPFARRKS
ncbi:MAG TPA: cation diffusion facilitator family transporter [Thermoanaerobaculia bacterium]|nr:cation diffusion facilitator family transporter [Thermoanaerobaculia bacterium]